MITVEAAEKIIMNELRDYGCEPIPLEKSLNRILAHEIRSDRDLPPFNRAMVDGIAIAFESFKKGIKNYFIKAVQPAGIAPIRIERSVECIEIMTGAAIDDSLDTMIRYEDISIKDGKAFISDGSIKKGQHIHIKGSDKKKDDIIIPSCNKMNPVLINLSASVGADPVIVKSLPKVVIISTGDELVAVKEKPEAHQIRSSNSLTIQAALKSYEINCSLLHIADDKDEIKKTLEKCISNYDVIILSGGISMGKFDFVPQVLEQLEVKKLFHNVSQRPGKPFWFGKHEGGLLVFALPGNPVSAFLCLHRYFIPWLDSCLGLKGKNFSAILKENISFMPPLQYFLPVQLSINLGQLFAIPVKGNGSGDFSQLYLADAFMELPMEQNTFNEGTAFRIWPFKSFL